MSGLVSKFEDIQPPLLLDTPLMSKKNTRVGDICPVIRSGEARAGARGGEKREKMRTDVKSVTNFSTAHMSRWN